MNGSLNEIITPAGIVLHSYEVLKRISGKTLSQNGTVIQPNPLPRVLLRQ